MPRKLFVTTALPTPTARFTSATSWSTSRPTSGCASSACRGNDGALRLRRRRARRADHDRRPRRPRARRRRQLVARDRRRPHAVPRRLPHRLRQLALDRLAGEHRAVAGRSTARCEGSRADRHAKPIEQFFDPVKDMFLPDRYIKGECPNCGAKDQYGDACEVCGAVYAPTDLMNPYSTLTGAKPVLQQSRALLLPALGPALRRLPAASGRTTPGRPAARGAEQGQGVARRRGRQAASATGTSRATRPTSASRSPTRRASTSTSGSTRRSATSPR